MNLSTGSRLGRYEIVARIGAGGMGEVYKAHDTQLGRSVAIKVLTQRGASDEAAKKRFVREARAISSLSHPNICGLYDIGSENGAEFLVMEFLEGETLAERLAREPLSCDDAIRYAVEIAGALERAHRQGITHRDLKPGNIMLTRSGAKLLDFGLARFGEIDGSLAGPLTGDHSMLGTIEYMAPEQLNGGVADARSDIFSFGVVLYEMLTGLRPFKGNNRASVIGAILFATPEPPNVIRETIPVPLANMIGACLQKDPDERLQTVHDLRLQLEWNRDGADGEALPSRRRTRKWRTFSAMWAIPALLAGIPAGIWLAPRLVPENHREVRFNVVSPVKGEQIDWPVISPDGKTLVFVSANQAGQRALWVRNLSSTTARRLPGTEGAIQPFWSPASDAVGFFTGDKLQTITMSSARPQTLASAGSARGGTWSRSGTILFTPHVSASIFATSMAGSASRPMTRLNEPLKDVTHRWPEFLPDGEHFLFVIRSRNLQRSGLYVGSVRNSDIKKVSTLQSRAIVTSSGWMLFVQDRKLYRQQFDLRGLSLAGAPVIVAENIEPDLKVTGATRISASNEGTVVFSSPRDTRATVAWVDRRGRLIRALTGAEHFVNIALSPDEHTIAVSRIDEATGRNSIWLVDATSGRVSPLVDDDSNADGPVWNVDGTHILYTSDRNGAYEVYEREVGNVSADRLVMPSTNYAQPVAAAVTGLMFNVSTPPRGAKSWFWPTGAVSPRKLSGDTGGASDLSWDGKWFAQLAHGDNASFNIHVQSLDEPPRTAQVTAEGGGQPTWRRDSRELYYVRLDGQVVAIDFRDGQLGAQTPLFYLGAEGINYSSRDFMPSVDGNRFVILQRVTPKQDIAATVIVQR